jgi:hypothetical protein
MNASVIKAILLLAAYEGAVATVGALTDADGAKIQIDPLIQDTGLRKKGLCVYEEAKVQYAALVMAFQDKTGIWPDPQLPQPPASNIANVAAGVAQAIASTVIPAAGVALGK